MAQYLVELYVSRTGAGGLEAAAARARRAAEQLRDEGNAVRYLRSIFVPEDETWFLLYEAPSAATVETSVALADLTCARVLEAVAPP